MARSTAASLGLVASLSMATILLSGCASAGVGRDGVNVDLGGGRQSSAAQDDCWFFCNNERYDGCWMFCAGDGDSWAAFGWFWLMMAFLVVVLPVLVFTGLGAALIAAVTGRRKQQQQQQVVVVVPDAALAPGQGGSAPAAAVQQGNAPAAPVPRVEQRQGRQ